MTRRRMAAGNWKMNGRRADLAGLADLAVPPGLDVLICPPATLIAPMAEAVAGRLLVGGQTCDARPDGAHTGDISAAQLRDAGASHVILGHSERRADHAEGDAAVADKARAAHAQGLVTLICVGETGAERDAGRTLQVVEGQLGASVPDCATAENTVIAYEPVWAIGTGRTPTHDQIAEVHALMRRTLAARFADGGGMRLLYGGSVKPDNAAGIFALPEVDGALVGGASLKAADFGPIIAALADAG